MCRLGMMVSRRDGIDDDVGDSDGDGRIDRCMCDCHSCVDGVVICGMRNIGRILADLSRRVTVSKGALPSVCCYTVFNSNALVQSIDISNDASTGIRARACVCVCVCV